MDKTRDGGCEGPQSRGHGQAATRRDTLAKRSRGDQRRVFATANDPSARRRELERKGIRTLPPGIIPFTRPETLRGEYEFAADPSGRFSLRRCTKEVRDESDARSNVTGIVCSGKEEEKRRGKEKRKETMPGRETIVLFR